MGEKISEKVCPKCGEPYEGTLMEHLMKTCPDIVSEQIENLKNGIVALEAELNEVNKRYEFTVSLSVKFADKLSELRKRAEEAEAERDKLKEQLQNEFKVRQTWFKEWQKAMDEAESVGSRLAEAEKWL